MNKIVNYSLHKENVDSTLNTDTRTSVEKNENILNESNDYKVQIKNFKLDIDLPVMAFDNSDRIGMQIVGADDGSFFSQPFIISSIEFRSIEEFVLYLNVRLEAIFNQVNNANPSLITTLFPYVKYRSDMNTFVLLIPTDFSTAPLHFDIFFTPKLAKVLYFGYTEILGPVIEDSVIYDKLYRTRDDQFLDISGTTYFAYANRHPQFQAATDNDSIVFVAHSIPINGSIEHKSKRIETQILKQYKLTSQECIFGTITYNKMMDDYYELISHYPLSRIDIELFIRKSNGELVPVILRPSDSYSCDIEFVKI